MRWLREGADGVDGRDIAAVWPSSASIAGIAVPEPEPRFESEGEPGRKVDRHGIW